MLNKVKLQNKIKEDLRKINIIHLLFYYNEMTSIKRTIGKNWIKKDNLLSPFFLKIIERIILAIHINGIGSETLETIVLVILSNSFFIGESHMNIPAVILKREKGI